MMDARLLLQGLLLFSNKPVSFSGGGSVRPMKCASVPYCLSPHFTMLCRLGYNDQYVTMAANLFNSDGTFMGMQAFLLNKAALLADASSPQVVYNYTELDINTAIYTIGFSTQPAVDPGGLLSDIFMVGSYDPAAGYMRVSKFSATGITIVGLLKTTPCLASACTDNGGTNNNCVPQPGAPPGAKIQTGDTRIPGNVMVAGSASAAALFFARGCNQVVDTPTTITVTKFEVSATAVYPPTNPKPAAALYTFADQELWLTWPSVAVLPNGEVCAGFSAGSSVQSMGTGLACVDPSSGESGKVMRTYGGPFSYSRGSGRNRWGDYR